MKGASFQEIIFNGTGIEWKWCASLGTSLDNGRDMVLHKTEKDKQMAMMLSKTYDALLAAGAPDEKAREAAEEIAGFERRLIRLEVMLALALTGIVSLVVKAFLA